MPHEVSESFSDRTLYMIGKATRTFVVLDDNPWTARHALALPRRGEGFPGFPDLRVVKVKPVRPKQRGSVKFCVHYARVG